MRNISMTESKFAKIKKLQMELFKNIALKLPSPSYVPTPVSKKRRAPAGAPKKIAGKQRREQRHDAKPPPTYVSDNTQDTSISE